MSMVTEGKIRYLQHRRVVLIRFDVCACRKSSLRYFINTWTLIVQNAYHNTFESRKPAQILATINDEATFLAIIARSWRSKTLYSEWKVLSLLDRCLNGCHMERRLSTTKRRISAAIRCCHAVHADMFLWNRRHLCEWWFV